MDKYKDIIDITHFEPKHPRMSMASRAAQFAPFAALTGYDEKVKEAGRLTGNKIEIEDGLKEVINNALLEIKDNIKNNIKIKVTYFVPDTRKEGGKYLTIEEYVKKLDTYHYILTLVDNTKIKIDDIIELEIVKQ